MSEVTEESGNNKSLFFLMITLLILLTLTLFVSKQIDALGKFIYDCGWLGLGVSILLYGVLGASPIPSEPFTILVTSIFGPVKAAVVATLGNLLAALVEFYVGCKMGDVTHFETRKATLPLGLNKLPADSPLFLILARMLPGFGPKCVSVISGVYHVPLWRYLWTTFISTLIGAVVVAFGGYKLLSLFGLH